MKVKVRSLNNQERNKYADVLYSALESLKTKDDIKSFANDLLTESERIMLGRRILIAQMLLKEKTYAEIMNELKVGIDTITKIHQWLEDDNSGYEKVVKSLGKFLSKPGFKPENGFSDYYDSSALGELKRKYPTHFLLFNIFDKLKHKK